MKSLLLLRRYDKKNRALRRLVQLVWIHVCGKRQRVGRLRRIFIFFPQALPDPPWWYDVQIFARCDVNLFYSAVLRSM